MATARRFERAPDLAFPSFLADPIRRAAGDMEDAVGFMAVERLGSAAASLARLQRAINRHGEDPDVAGFRMSGVGLKAGGRSSCFDLFSFPRLGELYAVDSRDDTFVCVAHARASEPATEAEARTAQVAGPSGR